MQHVSTSNSHLQAKVRTINILQGGCMHLGTHMAYSVFAVVFMYGEKPQQKRCKPYWIPNAHNHPVKH